MISEAFQRLVGFYLDNVLDRNPASVCLDVVAQADRDLSYERKVCLSRTSVKVIIRLKE